MSTRQQKALHGQQGSRPTVRAAHDRPLERLPGASHEAA